MRPMLCALLATASFAMAAEPPSVTVVVDFEQPPSELSFSTMQKEAEAILLAAGRKLNFKLKSEAATGDSYDDVVVMSFQGRCGMDNFPVLFDERGPLAYAHTVNGEVLPFGVVECDRVKGSVKSAMWGRDYKDGNMLMGRALGRVLAHELYHILAKTEDHAHDGVARKALSGKALISDKLTFRPEEIEKLKCLHGGTD
jgi:hypothetical protein